MTNKLLGIKPGRSQCWREGSLDWTSDQYGHRYTPRPGRLQQVWKQAYMRQLSRCIELAARKHCTAKRRRKLEKRAGFIRRWMGING